MHPDDLNQRVADRRFRLESDATRHRVVAEAGAANPVPARRQRFAVFVGLLLFSRRPHRNERLRTRATRLPALDD